jgi:hypothetical protein
VPTVLRRSPAVANDVRQDGLRRPKPTRLARGASGKDLGHGLRRTVGREQEVVGESARWAAHKRRAPVAPNVPLVAGMVT